jgi:hypothetical protein
VSWSDQTLSSQSTPISNIEQQMRNTAPFQITSPNNKFNQFSKMPYSGAQNRTRSYMPDFKPLNNRADPEVVDQLGGIIKTIDTMQETLRQHELRPYEYCKVHQEPIIAAQYLRAKDIKSKLTHRDDQSDSESEFVYNNNNKEMTSTRATYQPNTTKNTRSRIMS